MVNRAREDAALFCESALPVNVSAVIRLSVRSYGVERSIWKEHLDDRRKRMEVDLSGSLDILLVLYRIAVFAFCIAHP